ncbi:MAG TPA: hypothetical protein VML96_04385 [Egibacteraceae bacterium]|nr:hypothetical protein [Egibacteraceae bacterium]
MAQCETCGNDYDKAFRLTTADGEEHIFDSLECAASGVAPTCPVCSVRVLGHGVESNGDIFCCSHCAQRAGVEGLRDRV